MAARSKVLVWGILRAEIVGSKLTGDMDFCLLWL
jgi:hypothetical protein